jgi:hypothetical protein
MTQIIIIIKAFKNYLINYLKEIKPLWKVTFFIMRSYNFLIRNQSLIRTNKSTKTYENIFIFDTRINSVLFDSVMLLIRSSNFFYNDKWNLIVYEDKFYRNDKKLINYEKYKNNLINIFLQSLLILPNPPSKIKFIYNSLELLQIINHSKKIFPENYNFLNDKNEFSLNNFNEQDFKNFKVNQPIFKTTEFHLRIFKNYLKFRNIKNYITLTIRSVSWRKKEWNTDLEDMKLFINFIKKNNLKKYDLLILPDTEQDVPRKLLNLIKKNNLKYHIFNQGAFSIPLRLLSYSKSLLNMGSTNGPTSMLLFIKNNAYLIMKDPKNYLMHENFIKKFNKEVFSSRKFFIDKI